MRSLINQFLSGGIMMGFLASGYFFFRFWRKTHDSLFAVFAASFWVLAIERVLLLATTSGFAFSPPQEQRAYVFLIRFFAFMLIIIGFLMKNRRAP